MYEILQMVSTIPANLDKRNFVVKELKISRTSISSGILNIFYRNYFPAIQTNITCDFFTKF